MIFRLDDVEDHGNADQPNIAIMNYFISKNHKLSSEIIVNNFGNSGINGNVYKTVKQGYDSGLFELGIHGFNHVRHSQLSEEQQKSDFAKAKNKLISLFNDPNLRLFVPPFNDFDSDTIKAMAENKLDIFSSSYSSERLTPNVYKVSNSFETDNAIIQLSEVTVFDNDTGQYMKRRVYHVPFDISLFNMIEPTGTLLGQSLVDSVVSKADAQIANTGFAVITLHPTDISPYNSATGSWTDTVDDAKFQDLKNIVTALEAKGYGFSYMSDVTPAPSSTVVPGASQTASLTLNTIANVGWGTDVTVTGKLTDSASGNAIGAATVTFDGTGAENLQSVTTNADGTFTAKGKAPSTAATGWKVQAHFAGDSAHDAVISLPKTYNTIQHTVTIAVLSSKGSVSWGAATSFTATMTDTTAGVPTGTPVTDKTITIDGTGVIGVSSSNSTTTDSNGKVNFVGNAPD
ncbi:MAG: polysaccharide deacetylase family protein, partial [Nitrososphaera sp.]